ncbi:hypothetical protein BKA24_001803 [Microbacterium marinum]|uniref:Uncharacterized protein n=1 Tax=Microbacterium marinum TaxID=421115 RepID=A0A7W7BQQ6_9MICO|nr:hypothetical protein [Microbacterium marinum]MBB4667094.1 hypothetical protein [Microbacterium marinum]
MAGLIWFGNRERQQWILEPRVGMDWSVVKRSNLIQLEHGGVYRDDSVASHREGLPEWEGTPDELRAIRDFYNGVHGPGPFYWADPTIADINILSPNWATPGITADGDWPQIHSSAPAADTVGPSAYGVPTRAVRHTPTNNYTTAAPAQRFTVLIPEGYKLAFASFGYRTGTGVVALRGYTENGLTRNEFFEPLDPAQGGFHSTNLFRHSDGYRIVDIFLARENLTASTITLAGLRACLIREDVTAVDPMFASGEGAAALEFSGGIRESIIWSGRDRAMRRKSMSVKLVEVENTAAIISTPVGTPAPTSFDGGTP